MNYIKEQENVKRLSQIKLENMTENKILEKQ